MESVVRIVEDVAVARQGALRRAPPAQRAVPASVLDRTEAALGERLAPDAAVDRMLALVREGGDAAVRDLTRRLDGAELGRLEVGRAEIARAYDAVDPGLAEALRFAAGRIRRFHERSMPRAWLELEDDGATGQLFLPIERVGVYVPGGQAAYPSTVLMMAIPARVAGVREVVVTTPASRDGGIPPITLVAADVAGVDRVFAVGGAPAIAALAYGTETIPRVDKVLGPGNLFVALAKQKVYGAGAVGIDQIAGPTETLLVVDDSASPAAVAADMLAQAEHDALACAIAIVTSAAQSRAVAAELARQLADSPRAAIARESLALGGAIVVAPDLEVALELANAYAPEHLCLLVADPWSLVPRVRNAGGVFVGESSLEAVGDYTAGPSHVMPTGGTARFSSPLTVHDFLKITSVFALGREQVRKLAPATIALAEAEGLAGHARAVRVRLEREPTAAGGAP